MITAAALLSIASTTGSKESSPSGDQTIATLVIGAITLVLTIGIMWLIARGFKDQDRDA